MGVNLGEAVNFAPADWLRFGAAALGRLRHFRKPCVVSPWAHSAEGERGMLTRARAILQPRSAVVPEHLAALYNTLWQLAHRPHAALALPCLQVSQEEMLLRVAREQAALAAGSAASPGSAAGSPGTAAAGEQEDAASPVTCYYLSKELRRVVDEEWVLRAKLWSEGASLRLGASVGWLLPLAGRLQGCRGGQPTRAQRARVHIHQAAVQLLRVLLRSPPYPCVTGLRRSRRCDLAVGFEEGAKDDAECTFCHMYMHLSAGGLSRGRRLAGQWQYNAVWDAGRGSPARCVWCSIGPQARLTNHLEIDLRIVQTTSPSPSPPPLASRSRVRLLPRPPRVPAPRLPPLRLRDAGAAPRVPPLDAAAGGHLCRCVGWSVVFICYCYSNGGLRGTATLSRRWRASAQVGGLLGGSGTASTHMPALFVSDCRSGKVCWAACITPLPPLSPPCRRGGACAGRGRR